MKKLLALMLVLGITTVANATIELSFNGDTAIESADVCIGGTAWIDIFSDNGETYGCWLGIVDAIGNDSSGGQWTGSYVIYPEAGSEAGVTSWGPQWWYAEALGTPSTTPPSPGRHFDFEYECLGPECEWVYVELWDYDLTYVIDTIAIHQTPEPATMLLLGLGGLLLRRRK